MTPRPLRKTFSAIVCEGLSPDDLVVQDWDQNVGHGPFDSLQEALDFMAELPGCGLDKHRYTISGRDETGEHHDALEPCIYDATELRYQWQVDRDLHEEEVRAERRQLAGMAYGQQGLDDWSY